MSLRQEKVAEEIKKHSANFFEIEGNRTSLITVTRAEVSPELRNGTVYITVFPTDKEADTLNFLKRKRKELRDYIKSKLKIHTIPFLDIEVDYGEKNRQHIDELLRQ